MTAIFFLYLKEENKRIKIIRINRQDVLFIDFPVIVYFYITILIVAIISYNCI